VHKEAPAFVQIFFESNGCKSKIIEKKILIMNFVERLKYQNIG
jgi:hypothetical protein